MPKAKPVSLHPLSFDEAISAIIKVTPDKVQNGQSGKPVKKKK